MRTTVTRRGSDGSAWRFLKVFRSTQWKITFSTMLASCLLLTLMGYAALEFLSVVQQNEINEGASRKLQVARSAIEQGQLPHENEYSEPYPMEISVGSTVLGSSVLLSNLGWENNLGSRLPSARLNANSNEVEAGAVEDFPFASSADWNPLANARFEVWYADVPAHLTTLALPEESQVIRIAVVLMNENSESTLEQVRAVLKVAIPTMVLLIGVVAFAATTYSLRPVDQIRKRLSEISADDLSRRLRVPKSGDAIQRLAEEGNAALARLEASEKSQQEFIANAAHDLRTPLATLYSTIEIASLYPDQQSTSETLRNAQVQVSRLISLTEQLLEIERLRATDSAGPQLVDVSKSISDSVHLNSTPHAVTVQKNIIGEMSVVLGIDQGQLSTAVSNLLSNAQHHATSKVEIGAVTKESTSIDHTEERLVITVSNDGASIPAKDRERIFERFVRLDESRTSNEGGTGLGLSITAEIMKVAGGKVAVSNKDGLTVFTLDIPIIR